MKRNTLAHEELQALIGRALVEPSFCAALLNGHRDDCLSEFALTADEQAMARGIQATDLQGFAVQMDGWIRERRLRPNVTPFAKPFSARMAAAA